VGRPLDILEHCHSKRNYFSKLKTGCMNQDLAFNFGISIILVSELFTTFLHFLSSELKALFEMVDCDTIADGIPSVYQNVSQLRVVLDCTELMLQKPSDLQEWKETFSNYKHNETVKILVGMSPQLYINFISKAWGRASDKHITLHSRVTVTWLAQWFRSDG